MIHPAPPIYDEQTLFMDEHGGLIHKGVGCVYDRRGQPLAPDHPDYKGHYGGDAWQRDGAYHQGTVWPWLLGPLVDAHLLVYGDRAAARRLVEPLREHLFAEGCAGSINEIFDGDPHHAPRGAVAQAWSVAEVFRAWAATDQSAGHSDVTIPPGVA